MSTEQQIKANRANHGLIGPEIPKESKPTQYLQTGGVSPSALYGALILNGDRRERRSYGRGSDEDGKND
jgi:hypothetical protein